MPKVLLRLVAVVLLALIIPVQGMAAVMAGQCMAFGHHQDVAGQERQGHAEQNGSEGHDHAAHSHSDEAAGDSAEADGTSAHCGPCVACCASASIASAFHTVSPTAPHNAVRQVPYPFLAGISPSQLERPPLVF